VVQGEIPESDARRIIQKLIEKGYLE